MQKPHDVDLISGTDLYVQLDGYFAEAAREILFGSPADDSTLIHYIVPAFSRYSAGAQSVNRLLNYVNRHYVKRAIDEDKGWLSISDVLEHAAKTAPESDDSREKLSKRMKEKRVNELKKWGFVEGASSELMTKAEASAEAASALDRIVPISSMAHRRFRTEIIEPLLAIPKSQGKKKARTGTAPSGPKGRLARATKELLESPGHEKESADLAMELAALLNATGVRIDHPLCKRLAKFNALAS